MNIPHFHFTRFYLKIFGKIVTSLFFCHLTIIVINFCSPASCDPKWGRLGIYMGRQEFVQLICLNIQCLLTKLLRRSKKSTFTLVFF